MALQQKYSDRVHFIIADVDTPQGQYLAQQFNVDTIPAFFLVNGVGQVVGQAIGERPQSELDQDIGSRLAGKTITNNEGISAIRSWLNGFFGQTIPEALHRTPWVAFVLVFLGGLLTSISPCILSMIPVMVGYIGGYSQPNKGRGFLLALCFVLGLAVTLAVLGVVSALLGKIFGQIGGIWLYLVAIVALVMGLSLLGVINLKFPSLERLPVRAGGPGGAFLIGLFFGLVATPCATPVLAVLMTFVAGKAVVLYGGALLFTYGLGHGVPLLVVGTFTAVVKNLGRFQRWSSYITVGSGLLLIILGYSFLIRAAW